jgi:hypothetical protein
MNLLSSSSVLTGEPSCSRKPYGTAFVYSYISVDGRKSFNNPLFLLKLLGSGDRMAAYIRKASPRYARRCTQRLRFYAARITDGLFGPLLFCFIDALVIQLAQSAEVIRRHQLQT